ncbi:FAD-binding oxidoreductase [Stappia sp. P2PMeth1]|uniref:NAD(P)/FAD-dependent oxidoreductase n=1 Tax=Stappia sp. P2PMeth1 TaxID=2003586 RepID=UPI0016453599|nr:FAD-binding oxidoreductase [Stappia sp. P2PMeth1]
MSHTIPSLWAATARPPLTLPPPEGDMRADVAIIGAGYTGLAAALSLSRGGASVIVLDTQAPGFGASGRNGGQVIPGIKIDPDEIDAVFGEATTDFVGKTAETTLALIEAEGIDCEASRDGWVQGSVKRAHLGLLERRGRQWQTRGADVDLLTRDEVRAHTGTAIFEGGWLDRRAGRLHPLNYATGLAQAALAQGADIRVGAAAIRLAREGQGWRVSLANGASVLAGQVIVATNGYSGPLFPKLRASLVPAGSFQVATAPLPDALLQRILPGRCVVSDTRRVGNYFRIGPENRLMMGGRGTFSDTPADAAYTRLIGNLHRTFPETRGLPIAYRWTGRVAMTADHLPHVHQPLPGLTMAAGYNGRGVALSSALGTAIGSHLLDGAQPLPFRFTDIRPLPAHALHPIYATLAIWYYRLRDALET